MLLPIPKIADKVQKEAYDDLLKGSMRQFGDAIGVIAKRVLAMQSKSKEELALDWQFGEETSLYRRLLAAEALDRVPVQRRIFPAPGLAGLIFRGSEFELPGTLSWELWSQLLSRACDSERVGQAHPAFPGIISAMADDEMRLLRRAHEAAVKVKIGTDLANVFSFYDGSIERPEFAWLSCPQQVAAYANHLEALGLVHGLVAQSAATDYAIVGPHDVYWTLTISDFGHLFISAVLSAYPMDNPSG